MKRIISILSVVCMIIACFAICNLSVSAERGDGDVNGDGVVNSADARLILKYAIGNCELEFGQERSADVSLNNVVNFKDVDYLWAQMNGKKIKSNADSNKTETTTSTTTTASTTTSTTTGTGSSTTTGTGFTSTTKLQRSTTSTVQSAGNTTTKAVTKKTTATTIKTTKKTTVKTTKAPGTTKMTASSGAKAQAIPTKTAVRKAGYTPSLQSTSTKESTYMSKIKVKNSRTGKIFKGDTKDGLQMAVAEVVKYELGNSRSAQSSTEAWKAQAVVSYTRMCEECYNGATFSISMSSDIDLSTKNDKRIYDAVGEVLGQKLMVSGSSAKAKIPSIFYYAIASGTTSTCSKVYVEDFPYLQSVYSPETTSLVTKYYGSDGFNSSKTISMKEIISDVSDYLGKEIFVETKSGLFSLYATEWDGAYVARTNLYYMSGGSKVYVKGIQLRSAIGLRSHSFHVTSQSGDEVTIEVQGYGHGVGMSQIGAVIYANEYGWNYRQILGHYFSISGSSDIQICKPNW